MFSQVESPILRYYRRLTLSESSGGRPNTGAWLALALGLAAATDRLGVVGSGAAEARRGAQPDRRLVTHGIV